MAYKESATHRNQLEEYVAKLLTASSDHNTSRLGITSVIPATKFARKILLDPKARKHLLATIEHHSDGTYKLNDNGTLKVKLSAQGEKLFQTVEWFFSHKQELERFDFHPALISLIDIAQVKPEIFARETLGLQLKDGKYVFQLLNALIHELCGAVPQKKHANLESLWKSDVRTWQAGIADYLESLIKKHTNIWATRLQFYAPPGNSEHNPLLSLHADLLEEFKTKPELKRIVGHVIKLDWYENPKLDLVLVIAGERPSGFSPGKKIQEALEHFAQSKGIHTYKPPAREELDELAGDVELIASAVNTIAKLLVWTEFFLRLKPSEAWTHATPIILGEGALSPAKFSPQAPSQQCPLTKEYREQIHHFLEDQQRTIDQNAQKEIVKQNLGKKIAPIQNSSFAPEKEKSPFGEYAKDRSYPPKAKKP